MLHTPHSTIFTGRLSPLTKTSLQRPAARLFLRYAWACGAIYGHLRFAGGMLFGRRCVDQAINFMGKDKHGRFIPPKGKPSGNHRESELGLRENMPPEALEQDRAMTEKYTASEDTPAANLPLRHPNRHTHNDQPAKDKQNQPQNPGKREKAYEESPPPEGNNIVGMDRDTFALLARFRSSPCITIAMSTHKYGMDVNEQKDAVKFKNHLQQIRHRLTQQQWEPEAADRLLAPLQRLLLDEGFWHRLDHGLVIYLANGFCRYYLLPEAPEPGIYINHSFNMSPLLSLMNDRQHFYLLALGKERARLYKGDAQGMEHVPLPQLPDGDATQLYRTTAGARNEVRHEATLEPFQGTYMPGYLRDIDEVLWKNGLANEHVPLMLAAVDDMVAQYKQVSRYPYIHETALYGNFETARTDELYTQARQQLQSYFDAPVQQALANYMDHSATGLTSSIPADVIPAAYYGRVSYLFICKGEHLSGNFDAQANQLEIYDSPQHDNDCLCTQAAVETILNSGKVYLLDKEQMPADSVMAAFMRY